VVEGVCRVVGNRRVILRDGKPHDGLPYVALHAGDRFNIAVPIKIQASHIPGVDQ